MNFTRQSALACLFILVATIFPIHAGAQVLNNQVNGLLANNCAGLGTGGFPTPNLTGLGPNLAALCNTPQTQGANSAGGSANGVSETQGQVSPPSPAGRAKATAGRLARASEATNRVSRKLAVGTQFVRMARSAVPPDHAPHSAPPPLRSEGDE